MRSAGVRSHAWLLAAVLLVLGVAWMHTLAAAPLPQATHASMATAVQAMPQCAPDGHHDSCPGGPHGGGHAEAMCQSAMPPAIGAPAPTFTVSQAVPPATVVRTLAVTVAAEAAGGSGCGPPARSVLSIWRT
ncbi:DUF6153 family protein [Dactylosporangium sp. NPDC006015]|uniref:DUF6153 family protein n=1 Tax=Dactylosporangium sp. NPDC006015 TaxID=3154576 RepID=UPI0033B25440